MPQSLTEKDSFDSSLSSAGDFGRAQFIIVALNCYITAYVGWQAFIPNFAAIDVDFYCADADNATLSWKTEVHQLRHTEVIVLESENSFFGNGTIDYGLDCVDNCHKYVYKNQPSSLLSEFDLACGDRNLLASLSTSVYWFAYLISCFICGALSDRFGRKYVALCLQAGIAIVTSLTPLANNIYVYILLRFMCGFFALASSIDYIIMAEMMDKNKLSSMGLTVQVSFMIGEICCILFGYVFENSWKLQFLAMAFPIYIYMPLHFFLMPESARWLHSKGHTERAESVLRKIAKFNKKDPDTIHLAYVPGTDSMNNRRKGSLDEPLLDNAVENHLQSAEHQLIINQEDEFSSISIRTQTSLETKESSSTNENKDQDPNLSQLFATIPCAILTLTNAFSWFASFLVYFGLTYSVNNIGSNIFLSSLLMAIVELPSWFICVAMDKFGRKTTLLVTVFVCSIACAVLPFTEPIFDGDLKLVCAVIGKFLSSGATSLLFTYTAEQFPTVLRSTGSNFCEAVGKVANISAPFVINLKVGPYNCLPFILFAVFGLLSCLLVWVFGVETNGKGFITAVEEYKEVARTRQMKEKDEKEIDQNQVT